MTVSSGPSGGGPQAGGPHPPDRRREPGGRLSPATRVLAGAARRGGAGRVAASRIERLRSRASGHPLRDRRIARERQAALDRNRDEIFRRIWQEAAAHVGAEVDEFAPGFFRFRRGAAETLAFRDQLMLDSPATTALAGDKSVLQGLLAGAGLPVPRSVEAGAGDPGPLLRFLAASTGPCVVKPARGTGGGQGVTCGVRAPEDLVRAWLLALRYGPGVIIEEQAAGEEYRILILDGELLGAVRRRPPAVVGDGRSSVRGLIDALNRDRAAAGPEEVGRLVEIDLDCRLAVARAGAALRTVPAAGQVVTVKGSASQNGRDDNTTWHELAPEVVEAAREAAHVARLHLAGVDVVTPDPLAPLAAAGGVILEVNGTPGLRHHYQVREQPPPVAVAVPLLERLLCGPPVVPSW